MLASLATVIVGLFLVVIGIVNMTGNISSLHSYHRKRVREEDKKPLGRQVGLGSILCGASCAVFGALFFVYERTANDLFVWIGVTLLLLGLAAGSLIMLRAICKYNGGLF